VLIVDTSSVGENRVNLDVSLVRHLLDETLSNVHEHANPGSVRLEALITPEGSFQLNVTDNGPGIDTEDIEKFLQPLRHGDEDTTRRATGSGIGLAHADRLASVLGGTFKIASAAGHPTKASLELPAPHMQSNMYQRQESAHLDVD